MTTGSDILTALVQYTDWFPGESTNQRGGPTGPACPPGTLQSLSSSLLSLGTLGAGSDYASFVHFLGISSMDLAYTYDQVSSLPRHSQYGWDLVRSLSICQVSLSFVSLC